MNNYLEDDYKPAYEQWKTNQTPEGNALFLKSIDPIVQKGIQMYGGNSPLAKSQARLMALDAMEKYDPSRSRLQSHLLTQMQGLRRVNRKQSEVLTVPERILLDSQKLNSYTQELTDELGREPTDLEIADRYGINPTRMAQVRKYQPGLTSGQLEEFDPLSGGTAGSLPGQHKAQDLWLQVVYNDLPVIDQKILEYSLGLNGNKKLSNQEIARKLGRSPGAITQRKTKIQQLLDQEQELSPFI